MGRLKERIFRFKDRMVGGREPMSRLSLIVVLILDCFVLVMVFQGLEDHTRQLTSPDEFVPFECRDAFLERNWTRDNYLGKLQVLVLSDHNKMSYRGQNLLDRRNTQAVHRSCKEFYSLIKGIAKAKELESLFIQRQALIREKNRLTAKLEKSKSAYDTALLEDMARKKDGAAALPALGTVIATLTQEIEAASGKRIEIDNQITGSSRVSRLKEMLEPDNQSRRRLKEDFKDFQFIYPLKELGWQMIFMLPLFLVFYAWSNRSLKKDHRIQTLISSHLMVVAAIPIILKAAELVIDLIPRHFFKDLFNLLKSMHIIAIWHYIVICILVGAGLLVVYVIQKKLSDPKRIGLKRLAKGACFACGKSLPQGAGNCPFCGMAQFMSCKACGHKTHACGRYCINCGTVLDKDSKS